MVTLSKKGTLAAKRAALAYITEPSVVDKIFSEFPSRYAERNGGYTAVKQLSQLRKGDRAQMALIVMVDGPLYRPFGDMENNPEVEEQQQTENQPQHAYQNLDQTPESGSRVVM